MLKRSILFAAAVMSTAFPFVTTTARADVDSMVANVHAEPPAGADDAINAVMAGLERLKVRDYAGAKADFNAAISNPAFSTLTAEQRFGAYYLLALTEFNLKENDQAYAHLQSAGLASPKERDSDYWLLMCDIAQRLKKDDVLADALTQAVTVSPPTANDIELHYIFMVLRRADALDDGGAHRQKLLEALWAAHYQPADPAQPADSLWFDLFRLYVDKGANDQAKTIAASITVPENILAMRVDNRYRAFLEATPSHGDYKAAQDAFLARDRTQVTNHPRSLGAVVYLSLDLITANRVNEAQTVLDAAIIKAEQAPEASPAFDDVEDQMNWAYDTRTRILAKLGRWDDVEAAQKKARDVALAAHKDTVSQAINLGGFYNELGRPAEALAAVKDATNASPYGLMEAESVRACAYVQLKDAADLAKSLDYVHAHKADSMPATTDVMACTGDIGGLSRFMVEQLNDPKTRNAMLVSLQTYLPEPHPLPQDVLTHKAWTDAAARSEVQAAIRRYGVIESFPAFPIGE